MRTNNTAEITNLRIGSSSRFFACRVLVSNWRDGLLPASVT